jgi:hypothetical protein
VVRNHSTFVELWPSIRLEHKVNSKNLEIAHKSIQQVYLLQNWVEARSYWAVLFAETANAIGLLPEKRDTGNLQQKRETRYEKNDS